MYYLCLRYTKVYIGRFILSPVYRQLQDKFGHEDSLRQIHAGLNLEDRITQLIRKRRLFYFPDGTHIAGI